LTLEIQPLIKRESIWMDHKNPVSGSGDGVLLFGYPDETGNLL
jgi:hypothetical protein